MSLRLESLLGVVVALAIPIGVAGAELVAAPETRRVDQVDSLHGRRLADPYRWLEGDAGPASEVEGWARAQQERTRRYLDALSEKRRIAARITELRDYEKYAPPVRAGGSYFYLRNDGLQPFYALYRVDSLDGEPTLLLDPNSWSEEGALALDGLSFSPDGRYVAYGVVRQGADERVWRVQETASGRSLEDEVAGVRYFDVSWSAKGRGFYYGGFDAPARGAPSEGDTSPRHRLYFHRLGDPQADDEVVYERPDRPGLLFSPTVTDDGRGLVVTILKGAERRYSIVYFDLLEPGRPALELVDDFDQEYTLVGSEGPILYFLTDLAAPRRRIVAIDARRPERTAWREIVGERAETLESADRVGDFLIASYLKEARPLVLVFSLTGELVRQVELPGIGSVFGFEGRSGDAETFYYFSSFATPARIYRYDPSTGRSDLFRQARTDFDPDAYEVRQVFYPGKDGTRIPMFLAHRRGLEQDRPHPVLLYGYGGFGTSILPSFQASRLAWMEMGGVFVVANIRGGGEYGESWHQAGTRHNKQTVFDDFIAAAEFLIAEGYTEPSKLAIEGRSGGGLLAAAVVTQRPELFAAALVEFPVTDMLRFHQAGAGGYWTEELGNPEVAEDFGVLAAYSPYHRALEPRRFPATLITTAEGDERVPPWHAYKLAAALQASQAKDGPPILLRVEQRAGHGAGTPTARKIAYESDLWSFLVQSLGISLPAR